MNFFEYLKNSREILNLTEEEISRKMNTDINIVKKWEKNQLPDIEDWRNIIKIYNLNEDIFYEKIFEQSKIEHFPYFLFESYKCKILKNIILTEEEVELLGLIYFYEFKNLPYEYVSKKGSFKILNIKNGIESKLGKYKDKIINYLEENPQKDFSITSLSFREIFNLFTKDCFIKDYLNLFEIINETRDKKIEIFNNKDFDENDYFEDYNEEVYENQDALMSSLFRIFSDLNFYSEEYTYIKEYLEKDLYKNFFIYEEIEDTSREYIYEKTINKNTPWRGSIYIKLNTYSKKILEWYQSTLPTYK